MTEAEWLACDDPDLLLRHVRAAQFVRKSRLIAIAMARRAIAIINDLYFVNGLMVAARYADGKAQEHERIEACFRVSPPETMFADNLLKNVFKPCPQFASKLVAAAIADHAIPTSERLHDEDGPVPYEYTSEGEALFAASRAIEFVEHCRVIRDIFGNPFRPVALDPAWRTSTVVALAEGIYQDRAFDRLPILADALQDVGCDNADVLTHCRQPGEHVRGCWVVDLLTGGSESVRC
jgi:hypothetical protein